MGLKDYIFGKSKDDPEVPIEFGEKKKEEEAISFFDTDVNSETSFAITKLTAGGKFMRGNSLFFSLNGVEIYTEENNIIFVDTLNNTLFIREYDKVVREIAPEDPEQKQYIILYTDIGFEEAGENEFPLRWEAWQGRTGAYESIKINAPIIDIDKSLVLVDNVSIKDSLTVREFINYLKNADIIVDDEFDINSFSGSIYI